MTGTCSAFAKMIATVAKERQANTETAKPEV